MSKGLETVREALERWERKGLVGRALADELRAEAEVEAAGAGRRTARYALALAGGVVLLVAVAVFGQWLWPLLDVGARSVAIAAAGVAVHLVGLRLEDRSRAGDDGAPVEDSPRGRSWPAAVALQTAGLLVLLGAFLYSEGEWSDATLGGAVVGALSLLTPLLTAPRAFGRGGDDPAWTPFMPAVHVALAPAFIAVFLDRATPLSAEAIVWTVDAVLLAVTLMLVRENRRVEAWAGPAPDEAAFGPAAPGDAGWAAEALDERLRAFAAALYAGLILLVLTCTVSLDLETDTLWAVDAWWAGVTGLALWAAHRAPAPLRRPGAERQLVLSVIIAIPLGFATTLELLDWPSFAAALTVGSVGALGMWYGVAAGEDGVLKAGVVALVAAAWYYGVEAGGALGAVAALVFTAVVLLRLSTRLGRDDAPVAAPAQPPPPSGGQDSIHRHEEPHPDG